MSSCLSWMRFCDLEGARVGVWGAGREIASFAAQLRRRLPSARIEVVALDGEAPPDLAATLGFPRARIAGATDAAAALAECDVLVRSPGVSIHRPEIEALREQAVPVTTATALWLAEHGPDGVVAVTGTKGKSTTASLLSHLLEATGAPTRLAGNIGVPALDLLDAEGGEIVVLELSSYQIADLEQGPQVAVVTNLYDEHADWHGSVERYREEKLRLLGLPGVRTCVLCARDPRLLAVCEHGARAPGAEVLLFGAAGGWDVTAAGGVALAGEELLAPGELPLRGEHNALNLCAALTALAALGRQAPALPAALAGFEALPHRLELLAEGGGVSWVDDSISTTPESALAALASFPAQPIVLIAGGQDRGQRFEDLAAALAARAAGPEPVALVAVPSTGPRLAAAAGSAGLPAELAHERADLDEAVSLAATLARPGGVVLLSPAAPSYDRYRSFEERGEAFGALARRAAEEARAAARPA